MQDSMLQTMRYGLAVASKRDWLEAGLSIVAELGARR